MKTVKAMLVLIAFAFSISATSQITYGPRLGLNLANQSGDVENNKMLIGFNIGAAANYAFSDLMSVELEVLYDKKGAKYEWEGIGGESNSAPLSLGYINIPILAVATFGSGTKFFAEAGPTIGILTSVKYDGKSEYESLVYDPSNPWMPPTTETVKYKEWYKGTDVGLALGAGAGLPVGGNTVKVNLRYNFSLATIHAEPENSSGEDQEKIKNSVISINVAYMLKCGGKSE